LNIFSFFKSDLFPSLDKFYNLVKAENKSGQEMLTSHYSFYFRLAQTGSVANGFIFLSCLKK